MTIPRKAALRLQQLGRVFPAVVITGPRQAGKSTLLRHCLPDASMISLDDITTLADLQEDPVLGLSLVKRPVIIDEIQYLPTLFRIVKVNIDKDRGAMGQYFLTGSQIFALMSGSIESLAGRAGFLNLWPLSWAEIEGFENPMDVQACLRRMFEGFYPEVVTREHAFARPWIEAYVLSIVERDLRQIKAIENLGLFGKFLRLLATRAGQLLNISELAKETGVGATTITSWISLLETAGIGFRLQPYFNNLSKRLIKTPKWYFMDTGILCYLLGLQTDGELLRSSHLGHVFENMVVAEIWKRCSVETYRPPLTFYRTQDGEELDLILETGSTIYTYEIKFSASTGRQDSKSLIQFSEEFSRSDRAIMGQLLCLAEEKRAIASNIDRLHWSQMQLPCLDPQLGGV